MNRPLLITDCDEVLLHMVSHFSEWLGEAHEVDLALDQDFMTGMRHRSDGRRVAQDEFWPMLQDFFVGEMHRQTLVPGADAALAHFESFADVVVLTNLTDNFNEARAVQLEGHGMAHRVVTNQGPKGGPVAALIAEYQPSVTVFVDDLPQHHGSVAEEAPHVWRLHMIAEPQIAARTPPAKHAHARIDNWAEAQAWIDARLREGLPAPVL